MHHGKPIRGIVFDLDGTLIDSYGAIAESLNHARAGFDLPPLAESEVRLRVGHGLENLIAGLVGADRVAEGVARFRERYAEAWETRTQALPGAPESLARLHDLGYRMAVASNKPERFSTPILRRLGMLPYVSFVAGPDVVGATKPDPRMIRRCLERLAVDASETVYVGDMVLDVESGERAGVDVVLVAGGSSPVEQLRRCGRPVLESIVELIGWLSRRAASPG